MPRMNERCLFFCIILSTIQLLFAKAGDPSELIVYYFSTHCISITTHISMFFLVNVFSRLRLVL